MSRRIWGAVGALMLTLGLSAPVAGQTFAIQGGTVHTLTGDAFVGTVVIRDGRILAVGPNVSVPAGAEVIDATGRHVYPGMFDAVTTLGLTEVGAVDVTNDSREQGDFNPHLQAATAVHPSTEHIPVTRANGITHAMAVPQGGNGAIPGQASLIGLDGWTVEEMWMDAGAAMSINYPSLGGGGGRGGGRRGGGAGGGWSQVEARYAEQVAQLDEWLAAGRQYSQAIQAGADIRRDLKLEAMARVVNRDIPVLLSANGGRDIRNAVEWAERQNLRFVITGGREAWTIADWLAEHGVPVILSPTQAMPSGSDASYSEAYSNPGRLHAAGVKIAFATFNSSDSRTLPYEAAMAVPFGLPVEAALDAVMKNGAEMLGLSGDLGTIEVGKMGNVIVTDGNPLEIQTEVTDLFILGRKVSTDNRHRSLYEKYRARPRARVIS
ncbi:MAG: amidohydrolase family protein [Gemmatimonadetes bacterium]|nr:amidohydrolase family protein [Gemmatimonadota bacterium]MDA1103703.1 amidohydrolase family protein [Gemmatimonadota bacterium]